MNELDPVIFFKALSDPTRLNLILSLRESDSLCVCDLTELLDQPQSTISRHLGHLRQNGIVLSERRGTWMWYGINPSLPKWCLDTINGIEHHQYVSNNKSVDKGFASTDSTSLPANNCC